MCNFLSSVATYCGEFLPSYCYSGTPTFQYTFTFLFSTKYSLIFLLNSSLSRDSLILVSSYYFTGREHTLNDLSDVKFMRLILWSILASVLYVYLKQIYSQLLLVEHSILLIILISSSCLVIVTISMSLLIFNLLVLTIVEGI